MEFQHLFEIKRYQGEKTFKNDFNEALNIYISETPAAIKTSSNELVSWIAKPRHGPFQVLLFILYCEHTVAGFAMLTFHQQIKVMSYEYVAIKNTFSSFASYFAYLDLINRYVVETGIDVLYWITEINNKNRGKDVDKESTLFKKLLCMNQFGKLDAYYKTFPLGIVEDTSFDAILYLKTNDRIRQISVDTYLKIVTSIKNYYNSWYRCFMTSDEYNQYESLTQQIQEQINNKVSNLHEVSVSYIDCPLITPEEKIHTELMPKVESQRRLWWHLPLVLIGIIIISVILTFAFIVIFRIFDLELSNVSIILASTTSALITSYIAWRNNKK